MFKIKKGDTKEPLMAQLLDDNEPVDLTGCTVRFLMDNGLNSMAEIRDATNGKVWYVFNEGETDTTGFFNAEFEVTYPDFRKQTFPSEGYIKIHILKDLG